MKTVFVVFELRNRVGTPEGAEVFVGVRRTFEKAAKEAAHCKPALILEVATISDAEEQVLNRWELS